MTQRPVIIGMNNPYTPLPEYALFPHPPSSAGGRLLSLLRRRRPVSRGAYCRAFDRRNLGFETWSRAEARETFLSMRPGLEGRTVLLLGREVRSVVGVPEELILPTVLDGVTYRQLPHPSGRCLWYNDQTQADLAAMLMEELYLMGLAALSSGEAAQ